MVLKNLNTVITVGTRPRSKSPKNNRNKKNTPGRVAQKKRDGPVLSLRREPGAMCVIIPKTLFGLLSKMCNDCVEIYLTLHVFNIIFTFRTPIFY